MRALLALLLLANLGFLALSRGWLEPHVGLSAMHQREPHRLNAQIEPQSVRVLKPPAAGAAEAPATAPAPAPMAAASAVVPAGSAAMPGVACVQAGPLSAEQVPAVEAALQQVQAPAWQRVSAATAAGPVQIWLRIERADPTLRQRLSELAVPGGGFTACP